MSRDFFAAQENSPTNTRLALPIVLRQLQYNEQGLLPVVSQNAETGKVLTLAWMNETALLTTLNTGWMTYWSRSRDCLWVKGATSGNRQRLKELRIDCDGDALLCQVQPLGPSCHTGRETCFYWRVDNQEQQVVLDLDILLSSQSTTETTTD